MPDNCSNCQKTQTIFDPDLDKEPVNTLAYTTKDGERLCDDCVWDKYDHSCDRCGVHYNGKNSDNCGTCSYFISLVESSTRWKLVKTAPTNCWAGDWIHSGQPHFLVTLKYHKDSEHFIWCCGNDDSAMEMRGLPLEKAAEIFHQITDYMSMKDLEKLGLVRG